MNKLTLTKIVGAAILLYSGSAFAQAGSWCLPPHPPYNPTPAQASVYATQMQSYNECMARNAPKSSNYNSVIQSARSSIADIDRELLTQGGAGSLGSSYGFQSAYSTGQSRTGDPSIMRCSYRTGGGYAFSIVTRNYYCPSNVQINPESGVVKTGL